MCPTFGTGNESTIRTARSTIDSYNGEIRHDGREGTGSFVWELNVAHARARNDPKPHRRLEDWFIAGRQSPTILASLYTVNKRGSRRRGFEDLAAWEASSRNPIFNNVIRSAAMKAGDADVLAVTRLQQSKSVSCHVRVGRGESDLLQLNHRFEDGSMQRQPWFTSVAFARHIC